MDPRRSDSTLSRRAVLGGVAAGVSIAALSSTTAAARTRVQDLESFGHPIQDVTTTGGYVGRDEQGKAWLYSVSTGSAGSAGTVNKVDPNTGEVAAALSLEPAGSAWGLVQGPDGSLYLGADNGHLFRWAAGSDKLADLGKPLASERVIYQLSFDADGWLYGGTYPGGRVFRYHPDTGEVRDYGQALAGQTYALSTVVHGSNVYVGTQPQAHLIAFDVDSGQRREIQLPENINRDHRVYDLNVYNGLLFARISRTGVTGTLVVYDVETEKVVDQVDDVGGLDVSPPGPDGRVYLVVSGEVTAYDPDSGELAPTGLVLPGRVTQFRGVGWAELNLPDYPGRCLVGMGWKGYGFRYNPATGAGETFDTTIEKVPVRIRALGNGVDGRVYVGGTGIGGLAVVDPITGDGESFRFGEHQGIAVHQDKMYLGLYPRARIYHYDPDRPFYSVEYGTVPPGETPNPLELFNGDEDRQDRPFAMASAGGELAVGTVPASGLVGGTLTLYDPTTGNRDVYRDLVPEQSIMAVAYRDGVLYVGTSVYGGYGAEEPRREAVLFGFDVARRRKLWQIVPVAGERTISALAFDAQGYLWGVTAGVLFRFDRHSRQVTSKRFVDYNWPGDGAYVVSDLGYNRIDQNLYATMPNLGLIRIDPGSWRSRVLSSRNLYRLIVHRHGDIYVTDGAELLRYQVRS